MTRSRRRKIMVALLLVAVVTLAATVAYKCGLFTALNGAGAASPTTATSISTKALTSENTGKLETALASSDVAAYSAAWTPRLRGDGLRAAPKNTVISISEGTFMSYGAYGRVDADVMGSVQCKVVLHLELVDGQWLVFAMEKRS